MRFLKANLIPPTPSLVVRRGSGGRGVMNQLVKPVLRMLYIVMVIVALAFLSSFSYNGDSQSVTSETNLSPLKDVVTALHNSSSGIGVKSPVVVAYAVSLIKCGDFQSSAAGLTDAAIVLRHSVHLTSVRNPSSGSKYDYKMYAIVHSDAEQCSQVLTDAGFNVLVRPVPVQKEEIEDPYLRKNIHREWCCGHDEFVKLYAYTIVDHPIVVHVDIDYIFHKPMDDIFDTMIYDSSDPVAIATRERVPREFPFKPWPDRIDCYMTRDWPQVIPGRKAAYQAGLLIIRPDENVFQKIVDVIKKTSYVEGFGRDNGWGGKGYGAFVGAMAMQGLLAYVYDEILPENWVELNQCRFNHMGMDTLYRAQPGFKRNHPKVGKCRNDLDYCEDCMNTNVSEIYNIHFTLCRKPWNCIGERSSVHGVGKQSINEDQLNYDHCMKLITIWHNVRSDLENKMISLTSDSTINEGRKGDYFKDIFQGHCTENGGSGYVPLAGHKESFMKLPEIYG